MSTTTTAASLSPAAVHHLLSAHDDGSVLMPPSPSPPPPLPRQRSLARAPSPRHHASPAPTLVALDNKLSSPAAAPTPHANCPFPSAPLGWGYDSADDDAFAFVMPTDSMPADAHFDPRLLDDFADEFSSPSGYPSFLNQSAAAPRNPPRNPTRPASPCLGLLASPSPSATRSANTSQDTLFIESFSAADDDDDDDESTQGAIIPPALTHGGLDRVPGRAPVPKKRRLSNSSAPRPKPEPLALPMPLHQDDDLFGDDDDDLTAIDLTEAVEVPKHLGKPKADERVKLSAFQCVICMDDVTTLTVTHCGHLFCQQCLHSSLNAGSTRGKCPMCRTKIEMKPRVSYGVRTKGFWPLELKLMTTTRKGKRKAEASP